MPALDKKFFDIPSIVLYIAAEHRQVRVSRTLAYSLDVVAA